jgi:tRNA A-37 threonylcarbamoyl transferase component Bud32/tetratricopeptide (TPR) repeat protein/TolB-like protein
VIPSLEFALSDRYRVLRELGRGGMATVYLAQDLKLHRQVALKLLRPELAASLGNERFLREIEFAARLSHPHILPLHDSGDAGGHLYYAMPYVEGESLRQKLEREGQLSVPEVIAIVRAVASALTHAHQHGIIHRDIKPENILLAKSAEEDALHPLVADFGIAHALDSAGGERLTETGLALGTPAYMSPEQAAGERNLDARSDIYSLGCLTYELLAGHPPFLGTSAREVLARHALDPVPTLTLARPGISRSVDEAITRAMAKVAADRFATAVEFARALEAPAAPVTPPRSRGRFRNQIGVASLALLAGGGAWLLSPRGASVAPEAATIAVLPFVPVSADTMLARLGQDLAATLSVSLDGVGEIRTVDRFTLLAQAAGKESPSLDQAMTLGRRFGAGSVLHGSLARDGSKVRLDGALYRSDRAVPLARVMVRAPPESLSAITDSVTWGILHQVWQRGEAPSPSLASVTTRSVPALREFLEGERASIENRWSEAAQAYGRAIAADSSFSLAHYRYTYARWWEADEEPSERALLRRHRSGLNERDSLMVEAHLADTLSQKLRLYEELVRRYPNYWPGWFSYADALTHFGPALGRTQREAMAGFRRVLSLKPDHRTAWQHLRVASHGRDSIAQAQAAARLPAGVFGPRGEALWRRVESTGGRMDSSLGSLVDTVADHLMSVPDHPFTYFSSRILLGAGFPTVQIEVNRRVLDRGVPEERAVANYLDLSLAWAARGRWDSAMTWMDRYVDISKDPLRAFQVYGFAVEGAWLGGLEVDRALALRSAAERGVALLNDEVEASRARASIDWYDGILHVIAGDRQGLAQARKIVQESKAPTAAFLERSLAAFDRALAGERRQAADELYTLEWRCADVPDCELHHITSAISRLAAARWLRAEGELDRAARLLVWHEAGPLWPEIEPAAGPAYLERARIEDERGNISLALEYYDQFLKRYDDPVPPLRPLVEEAREASARLRGLGSRP